METPGTLMIQETHIQRSLDGEKGYRLGDPTEYYPPWTDNLGVLFRSLQSEYGRCISRVYHDTPDGDPDVIGWVFQKKREVEGTEWCRLHTRDRHYLHEVWVTYRWN